VQKVSSLTRPNQRVSLIQGPPHISLPTDSNARNCKSSIEALLAKALHDFSDRTILVVCDTNRALDQSLETLLKIDITESSIAHLGRHANSAVSQFVLQTNLKERYVRSIAERTATDIPKTGAKFLRAELEAMFKGFLASGVLNDMLTWIEDEDYLDAHCKFPCPQMG